MEIDLKNKLFNNILNLDLMDFESTQKGEYINKFENDIKSFSNLLINNISIITDIFSVIIVCVILLKLNIMLALITFAIFPAYFFVVIFWKAYSKKQIELKKECDNYLSFIQEILNSFKLIKIINNKQFFNYKFNKAQSKVYKVAFKKTVINIIGNNVMQIINFIGYITTIVVAVYEILKGNFTIGGLVAFNTYANTFTSSLFNLCNFNIIIRETIVSINRIAEIFNEEISDSLTEINKFDILIDEEDIKDIDIKNLQFSYPKSKCLIFENLNLKINKNELTIIKGYSGLGKTTLFNIISGLYNDYNGEILFGNININDIENDYLKNKIFLMDQESSLFTGTVKENLLLGLEGVSDDIIIDICKKVNIHNIISSMPQKYNTQIGNNKINLSVGQKQRLALARALIRNANIYLLDEITSSLDSKNEEIVMNTLKKMSINKTVVLISHRESTFKYADRIIDLSEIKLN